MEPHRVAICVSFFLCLGTPPAFARTLVVDNDGAECPQAEYTTIQQAVAAAQAGDKILVCPGLYFGTVVVETSDLRIEAQAGPGEVVLQGTGAVGELGFRLLNTTGVVLQGFTVQGFGRAQIRIEGGSGNTVRKNVTRRAVVNDGIQVTGSSTEVASANVVEHNTSYENRQDGIYVGVITDILPFHPTLDNLIRHNETFDNGQHGINLGGTGSGNVVSGNRVHGNRVRGINNVAASNGNLIEHNHVIANAAIGIFVLTSTGVTIRNNTAEGNGATGIALAGTANSNVVTNNRSNSNAGVGVSLGASSGNLVDKNELLRNATDGVRLANNSAMNIVQLNHIRGSGRDGIRAEVASQNTIERNVIRESAEHDAHDDSVGTGTGGSANFWTDNHCETENRLGLCDH